MKILLTGVLTVMTGFTGLTMCAGGQAATPAAPSGAAVEVRRSYEGVKANILKSAEKMPADGYGYRPDKDSRVFGRVLTHVIEAQVRSCGVVNGTAMDAMMKTPAETATKDEIVAALKASFAACDTAYASVTEANALEVLPAGRMSRSRIGFLWGNVAHDSEQYAELALYLRLKGIAPPSSEK